MRFGEAFGTCMRKYADFSGRARRSEYWWFVLAVWLISFPFGFALVVTFMVAAEDFFDLLEVGKTPTWRQFVDNVEWDKLARPGALWGLVLLVFLSPMMAAAVRRLHDIGLSGWWLLIVLFPMIGSAILLVMFVIDGQTRENGWGPDLKAEERPLWGRVPPTPPPASSPSA